MKWRSLKVPSTRSIPVRDGSPGSITSRGCSARARTERPITRRRWKWFEVKNPYSSPPVEKASSGTSYSRIVVRPPTSFSGDPEPDAGSPGLDPATVTSAMESRVVSQRLVQWVSPNSRKLRPSWSKRTPRVRSPDTGGGQRGAQRGCAFAPRRRGGIDVAGHLGQLHRFGPFRDEVRIVQPQAGIALPSSFRRPVVAEDRTVLIGERRAQPDAAKVATARRWESASRSSAEGGAGRSGASRCRFVPVAGCHPDALKR